MVAEFSYINEGGYNCSAVIRDAERVDHYWWSSRRNQYGKYDKHEVTVFKAFLDKLKNCTCVKVKVYYENR